MKILWIATKIPWPPRDGGRLLLFNTLRALAGAGHRSTLVAPTLGHAGEAARAVAALRPWCRLVAVHARLRPRVADALVATLRRRPWTAVRHRLPAMRRRVAEVLRSERFDLVHAEQVQALGSLPPLPPGLPVAWRAQNVESDLWAAAAEISRGLRRTVLAREARRLARWEGECVRRFEATVALTREDAERLAVLAGTGETVHRVAAPFEGSLPAASRPLAGNPPVVLLGSGGWLPNRRGARDFLDRVWPRVRERLPDAVLHVFGEATGGARGPAIVRHRPPADSREAFPPEGVLAVPLDVASGVRMKILEAWARGVPVVATPAAVRGLGAGDGRHLLVARGAEGFAEGLQRLHDDPELRESLVDSARRRLRREHHPGRIAGELTALYETLTAASPSASSTSCPRSPRNPRRP